MSMERLYKEIFPALIKLSCSQEQVSHNILKDNKFLNLSLETIIFFILLLKEKIVINSLKFFILVLKFNLQG